MQLECMPAEQLAGHTGGRRACRRFLPCVTSQPYNIRSSSLPCRKRTPSRAAPSEGGRTLRSAAPQRRCQLKQQTATQVGRLTRAVSSEEGRILRSAASAVPWSYECPALVYMRPTAQGMGFRLRRVSGGTRVVGRLPGAHASHQRVCEVAAGRTAHVKTRGCTAASVPAASL